ncbi:MAG: hypothetical protein AB2693_29940, partial [Candidatus Thiodiazotropha sp.]
PKKLANKMLNFLKYFHKNAATFCQKNVRSFCNSHNFSTINIGVFGNKDVKHFNQFTSQQS